MRAQRRIALERVVTDYTRLRLERLLFELQRFPGTTPQLAEELGWSRLTTYRLLLDLESQGRVTRDEGGPGEAVVWRAR